MKILVYEAAGIVPIEGLYEWLGGYDRIIFSNAEQKIQNFDSREVNRLLGSINFDTVIFYIPSNIQDQFVKLVNSQFQITGWQEDNTVKFSIKDIGLIGNDALSRFFDKMKLLVGLRPKKECPKECADILKGIVSDGNNPIDAIFVYDLKNKVMLCQTENSAQPGTLLKYNLKSIVESLGSLLRKDDALEYYGIIFLDGVFISSYLVRDSSNLPMAIGFVTAKEEIPLARFYFFCNQHLEDIKTYMSGI